MSLKTGQRFHSNAWTELPPTRDVINRVPEIAEKEKQPTMSKDELVFEWNPGEEILLKDEIDRVSSNNQNGANANDSDAEINENNNE
eukprot:3179561-Ditylum_brightwellii.AAC.1